MHATVIKNYIEETLHQSVTLAEWKDADSQPLFLRNIYHFYILEIGEERVLLPAVKDGHLLTPSVVEKHCALLQGVWPGIVCVCLGNITSQERQRLIGKAIHFIVPGTQLYLPSLGVSLRDYYMQRPPDKLHYLAPSTQMLLIYVLLQGEGEYKRGMLAEALNLTPMTIARALKELIACGICERVGSGPNTAYRFELSAGEVWEKVSSLLRSPVVRRVWLDADPSLVDELLYAPRSGLTALSHFTDIAEGRNTCIAIGKKNYKAIQSHPNLKVWPYGEPGMTELEVWSYNPKLLQPFSKQGYVDLYSLYLSLRDSTDERVQEELSRLRRSWKGR